jgi:hypothetical protein
MKRLLLLPFPSLAAFARTMPDPAVERPKITAEAFAKLSGALGEAIAKSGPAGALIVCSEKAPQIVKEVATAHGVTLRRATHKPRNPKNAADEAKKSRAGGIRTRFGKKEAPKPQVITNANGSTSFLAPIVLGIRPACNATAHRIKTLRLKRSRRSKSSTPTTRLPASSSATCAACGA